MTLYAEPAHQPHDIITDKDFNFVSHTESIIITFNQKLSDPIRTVLFMTNFIKKVRQFNYCSLYPRSVLNVKYKICELKNIQTQYQRIEIIAKL